jgi:uncharacterized OsmC-like protein
MHETNNNVLIKNTGGFKSEIYCRGLSIISDEPVENGGTNEGMTPYDLLLSALGSCMAMTLRMYAERKNYPLKGIQISLSHQRIHAEDCRNCETVIGRIEEIDVELKLDGNLDDEQRQRLLEISEKCPLHRTVTSEIIIKSTFAREVQ